MTASLIAKSNGAQGALQVNGADAVVFDSTGITSGVAGGGLVRGTAINTTSGTAHDFTGIPSWAKRITVMLNGVSTNGTSLVQIRIGAGSIQASGYTSAASVISSGTAQASSVTGFQVTGEGAAADVLTGNIVLTNTTGNIWTEMGLIGYARTAGAMSMSAGSVALSGALDRIRLTTVNGTDTFDAGSFNIMWE